MERAYTWSKMKQKKNKSQVFGWAALGVLGLGIIATIFGLSNTVADIADKAISKTPDAILASAGVSEEKLISVPVIYYDWRADKCVDLYDASLRKELYARQFEWASCGYHNQEVEQGLVDFELNDKYMPVATGAGRLTSNRGANAASWFETAEGRNESYAGALEMQYKAAGAEFVFEADDFYPLDKAEFSAGDSVNKDGHNHLFAMNFAVPFTALASGEESFEVKADDDTFIFVGNKLVIDMGGIHEATAGRFVIHENGEIYAGVDGENLAYTGVNVTEGDGSIVRVYHADRDSASSVFDVKFSGMNLSVTSTELADNDSGVQIAYDPSDPTYVAPLGETSIFRPDSTKGLMVMATIEGVMIVIVAVLAVSVARFMLKQKVRK